MVPQPRGLVLIISPWNYPVLLAVAPIVSALAAGNRVILKPSERTPHTSAVLGEIIRESVGSDWCVVHEGAAETGAYLLEKPFDHFFFTGSPEIGRIVARAAAEHWSGVTLELGGKSPAIVDETVDVEWAAQKIVVGKFLNAGQTCIAPDYVVAHEIIYDDLLGALVRQAQAVQAESLSPMCGVIDDRHANHLRSLWEDARTHGAVKADGDELDLGRISVVTGVPIGSRMMKEEIFGPILPVLRYQSLEDIVGLVEGTGPPLTTYLFTRSDRFATEVGRRVRTGSICRNDALLHFANPELPFGGVGKSGFGRTHGLMGFRAFSNEVSVLEERWNRGILNLLFPERSQREVRLREWLIRFLTR